MAATLVGLDLIDLIGSKAQQLVCPKCKAFVPENAIRCRICSYVLKEE